MSNQPTPNPVATRRLHSTPRWSPTGTAPEQFDDFMKFGSQHFISESCSGSGGSALDR